MGQHGMHAADRERFAAVDRDDFGVRVRRAKDLDVEQAFDLRIEGITLRAAHQQRPRRRRQAAAERMARGGVLDIGLAVERVLDRTVAGAATDIPLQRRAEITLLSLIERGAGQNHASGAEAALKSLRVEKGLLHRMNGGFARKAFNGRDGMTFGAKRRNQAAMHRLVVEQNGTQALPRARLLFETLAVDLEAHESSSRISRANRSVMCLRQSGLP